MASLDEAATAFDDPPTTTIKASDECDDCDNCHSHAAPNTGDKKDKKFDLRKTSDKTKSFLRWGIRVYQLTNSFLYCTVTILDF